MVARSAFPFPFVKNENPTSAVRIAMAVLASPHLSSLLLNDSTSSMKMPSNKTTISRERDEIMRLFRQKGFDARPQVAEEMARRETGDEQRREQENHRPAQ